jgi:curved DNA-binding protein CbpA
MHPPPQKSERAVPHTIRRDREGVSPVAAREPWQVYWADYYAILGINASDKPSADEIRRPYRKLARALHPDMHPNDKEASARFKLLNEAYSCLMSPHKRVFYDWEYRKWQEAGAPEGWDPGHLWSGPNSQSHPRTDSSRPSSSAGASGPRTSTWSPYSPPPRPSPPPPRPQPRKPASPPPSGGSGRAYDDDGPTYDFSGGSASNADPYGERYDDGPPTPRPGPRVHFVPPPRQGWLRSHPVAVVTAIAAVVALIAGTTLALAFQGNSGSKSTSHWVVASAAPSVAAAVTSQGLKSVTTNPCDSTSPHRLVLTGATDRGWIYADNPWGLHSNGRIKSELAYHPDNNTVTTTATGSSFSLTGIAITAGGKVYYYTYIAQPTLPMPALLVDPDPVRKAPLTQVLYCAKD